MSDEAPSAVSATRTLEIQNRLGLHARAAVLLVQTASRFERRGDGVRRTGRA